MRAGAKAYVGQCTSSRYEPAGTLRKINVLSVVSGAEEDAGSADDEEEEEEDGQPSVESVACVLGGRLFGFERMWFAGIWMMMADDGDVADGEGDDAEEEATSSKDNTGVIAPNIEDRMMLIVELFTAVWSFWGGRLKVYQDGMLNKTGSTVIPLADAHLRTASSTPTCLFPCLDIGHSFSRERGAPFPQLLVSFLQNRYASALL
jgi:hypothetical protein